MRLNLRTRDRKTTYFILLVIFMVSFSLLRIYRNSIQFSSSQQGGIWNIMAVFFVGLGVFSMFRDRFIQRGVFSTLILYSCLVWAHELVHMSGLTANSIYYFLTAPYFVFVTYAFFHYYNLERKIILWIIRLGFATVLGMLVYSFVRFRSGSLEDLLLADVYYLLCLLPLLLFYEKNNIVKVISIIATGFLIILSEKRAALIAYAIFVFCFFVLGDKNKTIRHRIRRAIAIIVIMGVSVLGYQYIYNALGSRLLFRMSMLYETGGAGRSRIYAAIWDAFKESSILEMICGHGRGSIAQIEDVHHTSAHSDFLHVLYVYGIVPFILFCVFYIKLFLVWIKMLKKKYVYSNLFLGGVMICFMLSLFSSFCSAFGYVTCGAAFVGVLLADWKVFNNSAGNQNADGSLIEKDNREGL